MIQANSQPARSRPSRLLYCGPAAAALFNGLVFIQAITRPGYEFVRHPLSLLAVGPQGWAQTANFLLSGLLVVAFAVGVRRTWGGSPATAAGPVLLAFYGFGMIVAGIFPSDPSDGFPLGAQQPLAMSSQASLHGMGFLMAQVSLVLACLAFAYRFVRLRSPGWAFYCLATAISAPAIAALGFGYEPTRGLAFFVSAAISLGWVAALGLKLRAAADRSLQV